MSEGKGWMTLRAVVELRVAQDTGLTSRHLADAVFVALDRAEVLTDMLKQSKVGFEGLGVVRIKEYGHVRAAEIAKRGGHE